MPVRVPLTTIGVRRNGRTVMLKAGVPVNLTEEEISDAAAYLRNPVDESTAAAPLAAGSGPAMPGEEPAPATAAKPAKPAKPQPAADGKGGKAAADDDGTNGL